MENLRITAPHIRMENISKRFGSVNALDNVSFDLMPGEIRALVGENGAGKSTLMNILYGMYNQDSGSIFIGDEKTPVKWSPSMAIEKGIGMIHQHFSLIYSHTVLENIVMPTLKWKDLNPKWSMFEDKINELQAEYFFNLKLKEKVENLSIGERQQVEILKALYQGARVLILDEPTGVLTPQQADALLEFLINLKSKGYSVVLVTHKLNEAMQISDKITVLRGGKHINTVETSNTSISEIARMMVDRDIKMHTNRTLSCDDDCTVLELINMTVEDENKKAVVDNISFTVGSGEIVGIAGVAGNGQVEMAEAISGVMSMKSGEILLEGRSMTNWNIEKRRYAGIGYIPEDRYEKGMVCELSVAENLVLDCLRKKPFSVKGTVQHKSIKDNAEKAIKDFNIKTSSISAPIGNLSGGNQQKVVLARTLMEEPKIIIACQPTRGLDFSATAYLREKLVESAHNKVGVLLISSDLDELLELSDRIIVMYRGKITGILKREEVDLNTLGLMMTGTYVNSAS